jgi:hypothetical protein
LDKKSGSGTGRFSLIPQRVDAPRHRKGESSTLAIRQQRAAINFVGDDPVRAGSLNRPDGNLTGGRSMHSFEDQETGVLAELVPSWRDRNPAKPRSIGANGAFAASYEQLTNDDPAHTAVLLWWPGSPGFG